MRGVVVALIASASAISLLPLFVLALIRHIRDPEHPYSIEQLGVVYKSGLVVHKRGRHELVDVEFRPTVPHCSLATLIGLCIRTKVLQSIPHIKFSIHIREGSHQTADQSQSTMRVRHCEQGMKLRCYRSHACSAADCRCRVWLLFLLCFPHQLTNS